MRKPDQNLTGCCTGLLPFFFFFFFRTFMCNIYSATPSQTLFQLLTDAFSLLDLQFVEYKDAECVEERSLTQRLCFMCFYDKNSNVPVFNLWQ